MLRSNDASFQISSCPLARKTHIAASKRLRTFSFRKIDLTWHLTVGSAISSSLAIYLFDCPSDKSSRTAISRGESRDRVSTFSCEMPLSLRIFCSSASLWASWLVSPAGACAEICCINSLSFKVLIVEYSSSFLACVASFVSEAASEDIAMTTSPEFSSSFGEWKPICNSPAFSGTEVAPESFIYAPHTYFHTRWVLLSDGVVLDTSEAISYPPQITSFAATRRMTLHPIYRTGCMSNIFMQIMINRFTKFYYM